MLIFALQAALPSMSGSERGVSLTSAGSGQGTSRRDAADTSAQTGAAAKPCDAAADGGACEKAARDVCRGRIERVLGESVLRIALPLPPRDTIIATLPDPIDTPASAVFDNSLEAIVEGLAEEEFVRDHFSLAPPDDDHAADGARCPDIVLFRNTTNLDRHVVLLLVGESSTWGIDAAELRMALSLLDLPAPCATSHAPRTEVRVLGPYYSGAASSSVRVLDDYATTRACITYRAASGSMTAPSAIAALDRSSFITSASFTRSLRDRQSLLLKFLALDDQHEVALLQESGTVYGRSSRSTLSQPKGERKRRTIDVAYPPNISALREAYSTLERDAQKGVSKYGAQLPFGALPLALDARLSARDMLRPYAPQTTMLLHDLALARMLTTLKEQRVGDAFVSGVLPEDLVFLSRHLKHAIPDMRVSLFQMESLFLRSDYESDLRGSLVVSAYPPVAAADIGHQTLRSSLGRDAASGIFHAVRWLNDATRDRQPTNLSLGVLANGRFWPLSMESPPRSVPVSALFSVFTALVLLLTAFNVFIVDAVARGLDTVDVRRYASFLTGFLPCWDPRVRQWHQVYVCVAQCAVFSALLVLTTIWWMLELGATRGVLHLPVAVGCSAMLVASLLTVLRTLGPVLSAGPSRTPAVRALCAAGIPVLVVGLLAFLGLITLKAEAWSLFLVRALDVESGVSPLPLLFLGLAFIYHYALAHASRLRVMDYGDSAPKTPGLFERPRNLMMCRALPADTDLEAREAALFDSALMPVSRGYYACAAAVVLLPMLVAFYIRPGSLFHLHGLTVETPPLTAAMVLVLALSLSITATSMLRVLSLWERLSDVLRGLASSDLLGSFERISAPFHRTVATQLAMGRQDVTELDIALRQLGSTPSARSSRRVTSFSSLTSSDDFTELLRAAERARAELNDPASAPHAEALRNALATYIAFSLTRWIKQFRFLIWVLTVGSAVLLLTSTSYVFTLRHFFVTMFSLLTVAGVLASATVFLGVERDEVLSRIGGTTPGQFTVRNNLLRIVGWGVLPVALAVATYFPDAMRGLLSWFDAFAGVQ